ncbi:MAG: hypothetical protein SGJ11_12620 [Phycisphaerae bacterium]|mgnify:CR=1 FL=1|nr:hypothetical protein [Phycisphaerae bacterium]
MTLAAVLILSGVAFDFARDLVPRAIEALQQGRFEMTETVGRGVAGGTGKPTTWVVHGARATSIGLAILLGVCAVILLGRDALAAAMSTSIASIILVISLSLTAPRSWQRMKPAFVGNAPPTNPDPSDRK